MADIEVVGLSYYPIKSCGAVDAQEVTFTEYGIKHDRELMLVGSNGQFLSQRVHPKLALVQTRIEDGSLIATAPGMGELAISMDQDPGAEQVSVTLWKKPGTGYDQGGEASAYFSEYLHLPESKSARLLRVAQPRSIKPECRMPGASERTAFADGFPLLLGSMASLAALNGYLVGYEQLPITMDRFRPNIVVDGIDAYDEDFWRKLRIGELEAFVVRACARCPMPNVDQKVGELTKVRPVTEALRATRQGIDPLNGTVEEFFAQNLVHVFKQGVEVRRGDKVTVVERAAERNFQAL